MFINIEFAERKANFIEILISTLSGGSFVESFINMSYMYYSVLGSIITVLVGAIVSLCTQSPGDVYDKKLIHPMLSAESRRKHKEARNVTQLKNINATLTPDKV